MEMTPLAELWSLRGRTAIVTGAARGIGASVCARLGEAGARVVLADLDLDEATKAALSLRAVGVDAVGVRLDASDPASIRALADSEPGLTIWVNNAGVYPVDPALDMTVDRWRRVMALNVDGVFFGAREAARVMAAGRQGGVIVNIASVNSYRVGAPGLSHYVTSKHAVVGLTRSLAVEFAPLGVRVVAVAPSTVDTPGIAEATESLRPLLGGEDVRKVSGAVIPLGRIAQPDDVARAVLFCASDMAAFVTGSVLVVDGGQLAT